MRADVFFDSNVLLYSIKLGDPKADRAEELLAAGGCISVQVLNEFANVCRRKVNLEWRDVQVRLNVIRKLCLPPLPITVDIHEEALKIASRYRFSLYDALIVAAASKARCSTLYSEDMQHGQLVAGVRIVNPFL